jgi:hypothetical protein
MTPDTGAGTDLVRLKQAGDIARTQLVGDYALQEQRLRNTGQLDTANIDLQGRQYSADKSLEGSKYNADLDFKAAVRGQDITKQLGQERLSIEKGLVDQDTFIKNRQLGIQAYNNLMRNDLGYAKMDSQEDIAGMRNDLGMGTMGAPQQPNRPSRQQFISTMRSRGSKMSDRDLNRYYDQTYGG